MIEYKNTRARCGDFYDSLDGDPTDPPDIIEPRGEVRHGYMAINGWELVSTAGCNGVIIYTWRREIVEK